MRILIGLTVAGLAACGSGEGLRDLRSKGTGPDEFTVLPVAPLEIPEVLTLPTPTPGGTNLTDPNPTGEAIAALGGRPGAQAAGGIPAGDAALVVAASRNGVDPNIRADLAAADAQFRAGKGRFSFFDFLRPDRYFAAYAAQALDAHAVNDAFRAAGVPTPSAPPAPE